MRLSEVLRQYRWASQQGLRPLAKEIGLSGATLNRIELGKAPDYRSLLKLLHWLLDENPSGQTALPNNVKEAIKRYDQAQAKYKEDSKHGSVSYSVIELPKLDIADAVLANRGHDDV